MDGEFADVIERRAREVVFPIATRDKVMVHSIESRAGAVRVVFRGDIEHTKTGCLICWADEIAKAMPGVHVEVQTIVRSETARSHRDNARARPCHAAQGHGPPPRDHGLRAEGEAMTDPRHPMQPLVISERDTIRFKSNAIVLWMLDELKRRGVDLNDIALACAHEPGEDWDQFNQLIGYSFGGFCEVARTQDASDIVWEMHERGVSQRDAEANVLRELVDHLRATLREPMAALFGVHPDNLDHDR